MYWSALTSHKSTTGSHCHLLSRSVLPTQESYPLIRQIRLNSNMHFSSVQYFLGQPPLRAPNSRSWPSSFRPSTRALKVNELITVSKTGRLRDQLAGKEPLAPPTPNGTQPVPAGDTSKEYKSKIRAAIAKLHTSTDAGDVAAKEAMATNYLIVMADSRTKTSGHAFADVAAAVFRNREHSARSSSMTVVPLR